MLSRAEQKSARDGYTLDKVLDFGGASGVDSQEQFISYEVFFKLLKPALADSVLSE